MLNLSPLMLQPQQALQKGRVSNEKMFLSFSTECG